MSTATVTSKGQITIPKEIRSIFGLEAGDKVDFVARESGEVSFIPVKNNITSLKGIVAKPKNPISIEDMKATIKKMGGSL